MEWQESDAQKIPQSPYISPQFIIIIISVEQHPLHWSGSKKTTSLVEISIQVKYFL
jgi:hypothetical protein